jgi:hypothetical protein
MVPIFLLGPIFVHANYIPVSLVLDSVVLTAPKQGCRVGMQDPGDIMATMATSIVQEGQELSLAHSTEEEMSSVAE